MHAMPSGTYTIRLSLGGTTTSQQLAVSPDPRSGGTLASEREHGAMVVALATMSADINRALSELRDVRTQARTLAERARSAPVPARDAALQTLISRIDSLEAVVVSGGGGESGALDIMSNPPRLNTDVSGLLSAVEGSSAPVTSGEREQLARLRPRVAAFRSGADRVLTTDLERLNTLLTGSGLTAIARPKAP